MDELLGRGVYAFEMVYNGTVQDVEKFRKQLYVIEMDMASIRRYLNSEDINDLKNFLCRLMDHLENGSEQIFVSVAAAM